MSSLSFPEGFDVILNFDFKICSCESRVLFWVKCSLVTWNIECFSLVYNFVLFSLLIIVRDPSL